MRSIFNKAKRLPNYLARFGMLEGLRLYCTVEFGAEGRPERLTQLRLRGFPAPLQLRATRADHSAFWICQVAGQYDTSVFPQQTCLRATYDAMVRDGRRPLILDAGANIGMSALWFAQCFPQAHIYAVEPEAANFDLLVRNTAMYADRITTYHGGVWPRTTRLVIENPGAGAQHFRTRETLVNLPDSLEAKTIDDIMAECGAEELFIAKIDIEGGQKFLFSENTDWVARTHMIVLELDDDKFPWQGTSRPFFACASKYPFDYLLSGENIFCFQDMSNRDST